MNVTLAFSGSSTAIVLQAEGPAEMEILKLIGEYRSAAILVESSNNPNDPWSRGSVESLSIKLVREAKIIPQKEPSCG